MIKTKRKIELDPDVCAAERCNRKTGLAQGLVEHRGEKTVAPFCSTHIVEVEPAPLRLVIVDDVFAFEPVGMPLGMAAMIGQGKTLEALTAAFPGVDVAPLLVEAGFGPIYDLEPKEEPTELVLRVAEPNIATETAEVDEVLAMLDDFTIVDSADEAFATDAATNARNRNRELEEEKQAATRPISQGLEKIRSWFRPRQDAYAAIERRFKDAILDYRRRLEEARAQALADLETAEPEEVPEKLAELSAAQAPTTAGMSIPQTWDFELLDQSLVPEEYKTVWAPTVRKAIAGKDGLREIPGLRIFSKGNVRLG